MSGKKKSKKLTEDGSSLLDKVLEVIHNIHQNEERVVKSNVINTVGKGNEYAKESNLLYQFWLKYKNERYFSKHALGKKFLQIFRELIKNRLCNDDWNDDAPTENILRLFQCLRIFMRDQIFQHELYQGDGLKHLAKNLEIFTQRHLSGIYVVDDYSNDILKEIANICQKLSAEKDQRSVVTKYRIHEPLVLLLSSHDVFILHLALYALIGLTKSDETKSEMSELNCTEILLQIMSDYDNTSKQLGVTLLRQLSGLPSIREQIKIFHGVPILLSMLRSDSLKLLWNVVWIVVELSEDHDTSNEIRLLGGIPLLLSLLQDGQYFPDDNDVTNNMLNEVTIEQKFTLKSAVCAALTELIMNDANARFVVQANGVFLIAMLIFPSRSSSEGELSAAEIQLQKNAFRTLRFLFSMERNRQLFKRLFPPDLFEVFIDVGHYQKELDSYDQLVNIFNELSEDELVEMQQRVHSSNQNKAPSSYIQQYAVYEHLGSGAFGSVYKVKKKGGQTFLAMKEISTHRPEFGKSVKEKNDSISSLINECSFVKKQLSHRNIVKYHKAFLEGDRLYIIMDLIEGAPLGEHFNSLKEKRKKFSEERIWIIFIQMVLALRYIHKDKQIVHRDLTPNNIMLDDNDKVTITDFGLARQKTPDASKLTSMVGTILYSCPEVIGGLPYGEKADVWALGCILYQMATLEPPFFSNNMLTLAKKIMEADYLPIQSGRYSDKVSVVINRCLTAASEQRPDIVEVASLIPEALLIQLESLRTTYYNLERKLEKERKKVQKQSDHLKHYIHEQTYRRNISEDYLSSNELSVSTDDFTKSTNNSQEEALLLSPLYSDNPAFVEKGSVAPLYSDNPAFAEKGSVATPISMSESIANDEKQMKSSGSTDASSDDIFVKPSPVFQPVRRKLIPLQNRKSVEPVSILQDQIQRDLMKRTQSCSYIDNMKTNLSNTPPTFRPISAHPTISISPRKVREINDPVLQMLSQLHKLVYISQLPPSLKYDSNKRVIEQFKRSLFAPPSSAMNLKNELKKLIESSKEQVDIPSLNRFDSDASFSSSLPRGDDLSNPFAVTYEDLQGIIESKLLECGYYNITPINKSKPLGPIASER